MRPTAAKKNPARSSGNLGVPREDEEGMAQAFPIVPSCISRAGTRVRPERSPCNKPLHLPSSKDSFPGLPASPPATGLFECL